MLEELLTTPGVVAFVGYLHLPETRVAVILPGLASLAVLTFYARSGRISRRLQLLWILALLVSYFTARWVVTSEVEQLYIYSAFSVACAVLLFKRIYVPAPLAFALTFLSLWWVDVIQAFCRALECDAPIELFYHGVGGAGLRDALVLVPLMTAAFMAYGASRIRARGERLAEL
jgi:hypothetical protein